MGKIITKVFNRFDGGRSIDYRSKNNSKYALTKHFDAFTYPHKLVPRENTEEKNSSAVDIVKFLYANNGSENRLFALDRTTGYKSRVRYWNGSVWIECTNGTSTSDNRIEDVFFEYKDYIYMFGGNHLKRYDITGSASFDDTYQTLTPTLSTVAQPILHPVDDNAYFFINSDVYRLDDPDGSGTGWSKVLELPTNLKIVQGVVYGDYIAIACVDKDLGITSGGKSVVYIWDRDSSLETVSRQIDFGYGIIRHLANLDGRLVVVMDTTDDKEIVIKIENGRFSRIANRIKIDTQQVHYSTSQVKDNKLYFPMKAPLDNDDRFGLWSVDSAGRCELDFEVDNATKFDGIYWTGDIWWFAHSGTVARSVKDSHNEGTYETLFVGDAIKNHKLLSASLLVDSGLQGSVTVGYRTREALSFTNIFSFTPTNTDRFHKAINIESSGDTLPDFREMQFQVYGRVKIVALVIQYEELDTDL